MDRSPPDGSVTIWLRELKAGDPEAAKRLWDGYFARLVALARQQLRTISRAVADEEDVALSAFKSFWLGVERGRFPRLDDRDDLWQVLFTLTTRKAVGQIRYETRDKRDSRRTVHASATSDTADSTPDIFAAVAGVAPSPELVSEVVEKCSHFLGLLGEGQLRQVALLKLEGYTNEEIGAKINRSVITVERRLNAIRQRWSGELTQ